ncbi:putative copper resistance protein D [Nonomuraea solani]|uniref:Putative copper resistance protein D n=1 Tax=Nonomuraea solani TaxID=1144553 RepID=A0A1H6ES54_9ACTN|nr:cytochrome c oxidase assembly protein [Nonomuraea solani]SEG99921.1 putative copper resistance protein D [Nonomuraea solani]
MRASARISAGTAVAVGLVALVLVLPLGGAAEPQIAGLPTAGPLTERALMLARFLFDLCGVGTVGTLLAAAVLAPRDSPEKAACVRAAGWWALGWTVTALLVYVLTVSDVVALPVTELLADPGLLRTGGSIPQAEALLLVLAMTLATGLATRLRRLPAWVPLVVAAAGLLPPAYVGHAASAGDHDLAVSALTAHLLAMAVWVGGLGAVLLHFRRSASLRIVLPRFSTIALCCFAAVTVSGVAAAWVRLPEVSDLWRTEYGWFLLAKSAALALLAMFGWTHRQRTVDRVADRSVRHVFVRLAVGEVIVMAAAMALAVGLSRTPPPVPAAEPAGNEHDLLEYALAPVSPSALFTEVRPDALILLLLALPALAYQIGTRRAGPWPYGRTLAWYAGLALIGFVLLGGVGGYARAMLSIHAVQQVVLTVVAPLLLCLGAPLTLAGRATTASSQYGRIGSRAPGRALFGWALVAYVPALPLLHRTGWLQWSLSGHVAHLATAFLLLGASLPVFWLLTAVDPLPRVSWAFRAGALTVVAAVHLVVGVSLLFGTLAGADWFLVVAPPGAPDLFDDQRLAAAVYLLGPLLPLSLLAVRLLRARRPAPEQPEKALPRSQYARPVPVNEGAGADRP